MLVQLQTLARAGVEAVRGHHPSPPRERGASDASASSRGARAGGPGARLLEEGGELAARTVLAKQASIDAVESDSQAMRRLLGAAAAHEEALSRIDAVLKGPEGPDPDAVELRRLLKVHTQRLELCRRSHSTLTGQLPSSPPMTEAETDAARILRVEAGAAGGDLVSHDVRLDSVASTDCDDCLLPLGGRGVTRKSRGGFFNCCDDEGDKEDGNERKHRSGEDSHGSFSSPSKGPRDAKDQRLFGGKKIEEMTATLFELHDLNANGVLEEEELIKLNQKIAMLHYGKDVDRNAVRLRYQELFRDRLDPEGKPVPYATFQHYMLEALEALDPDVAAQELILEQIIEEARSARAAFHCDSFTSQSDAQFMPHLTAADASLGAKQRLAEPVAGGAGFAKAGFAVGALTPVPDDSREEISPPPSTDLLGRIQ